MDKKDLISSYRSNVYENFLMHWKYIKREKVGDKWKYTYKDEKKTSTTGKTSNVDISDLEIESYRPELFGKWEKTTFGNKHGYVDGNGLFYEGDYETAKRAKFDREWINNSLKVQEAVNKAKTNSIGDAIDSAKKSISDALNKTSNKVENTINTAKDKLGVDEREAYKDAKAAYENATDKKNEADQEAEKARRRFLDDPKSDYKADDAILKVNMLRFWREKEQKRGEEYMNAKSEYMDTPLGTALRAKEAIDDARIEVEIAIDKIGKKITSIGKKDSSKETLSDMNSKNVPENTIEQEVITDKDIPSKKKEIVKTFDNSSKTFDDDVKTRDDATGVIPNVSKNKSADVSRNQLGWINAKRDLTNEEIKAESEQAKEVFDSYFKYRHKLEDCQSSIFCETYEDVDPKTKVKTGTYTSVIYLKKNDGQQLIVSQITKPDKNTSDVKKIRDAISDHYMEKKFGKNWNSAYRPLKKK